MAKCGTETILKQYLLSFSVLGMKAKGADSYLAQIQRNFKMADIQKIVFMETVHIVHKILWNHKF